MKALGYIALLGVGALVGYGICKAKSGTSLSSPSGIGTGGSPRFGVPKTEAERLATHEARYGTEELPTRGTGLQKQGII